MERGNNFNPLSLIFTKWNFRADTFFVVFSNHTFFCSLLKNMLSLTLKYIHFIQSTFFSVDTQPFASKGIP